MHLETAEVKPCSDSISLFPTNDALVQGSWPRLSDQSKGNREGFGENGVNVGEKNTPDDLDNQIRQIGRELGILGSGPESDGRRFRLEFNGKDALDF